MNRIWLPETAQRASLAALDAVFAPLQRRAPPRGTVRSPALRRGTACKTGHVTTPAASAGLELAACSVRKTSQYF